MTSTTYGIRVDGSGQLTLRNHQFLRKFRERSQQVHTDTVPHGAEVPTPTQTIHQHSPHTQHGGDTIPCGAESPTPTQTIHRHSLHTQHGGEHEEVNAEREEAEGLYNLLRQGILPLRGKNLSKNALTTTLAAGDTKMYLSC